MKTNYSSSQRGLAGQAKIARLELLATVEGCKHEREHVRYLTPHTQAIKWCSYCGAFKVNDDRALWSKPHLGREGKR